MAFDFEKQLPVFGVGKFETEFAKLIGTRLPFDTFSTEQKDPEILNPLIGLVGIENLAHQEYRGFRSVRFLRKIDIDDQWSGPILELSRRGHRISYSRR